MLKKSASRRSPLFGSFGLSRLFGFWLNETNQMNQINKTNQFEHPAWVFCSGPRRDDVRTFRLSGLV
jgi:hypothetical protein